MELDRTAILLVGHGTRDKAGIGEFHTLADLVAERFRDDADVTVDPCFLELASPPIADALYAAVATGARRAIVMPLLLFAAGHANRDIPSAVNDAVAHLANKSRSQPIQWRQTDVLDCHPALVALSQARCDMALRMRPAVATESTCLTLIGRGSRDADATESMRRFASLRAACGSYGRVETAFVAMATPDYRARLPELASQFRRIIVQPHLLFRGQLLAELASNVEQLRREFPNVDWVLTEHLGPDVELASIIETLCRGLLAR